MLRIEKKIKLLKFLKYLQYAALFTGIEGRCSDTIKEKPRPKRPADAADRSENAGEKEKGVRN